MHTETGESNPPPRRIQSEPVLEESSPSMERRTLVILILLAVVVSAVLAWFTLAGAHFWRPHAAASRVEHEVRAVDPFHNIDLNGSADVTLVQGAAPAVTIESTAGAPVSTHVHDGTLTIDTHETRRGWRRFFNRGARVTPQVTVTFTELSGIESSGAVKLRSTGIRTPALHVDVAGAGSLALDNVQVDELFVEGAGTVKASINGRATHQRIEISGAGDYQAADLASDTARVDVSGAGKVVVRVAKTLRVDISGAGAVTYIGNPAVEKTITGMGSVRQQEDKGEVRANDWRESPAAPARDLQRNRMLIA